MLDIKTTFLAGAQKFFEGERVSEDNFTAADIERFVGYGWLATAGDSRVPLQTGVELTLDIQDGRMGHKSEY